MLTDYDREFPEDADLAKLTHNRIYEAAVRIAAEIRRDLSTVDRPLTAGLRSALRIVIDADREDD